MSAIITNGKLTSHIWKRMKRGSNKDQRCYVLYCQKIIPARTPDTWIYDQPYKKEYACPHHEEQ